MLRRVNNDEAEEAKDLALIMFRTATIRSGFMLQDTAEFSKSIERLISKNLGIPEDEQPEDEEEIVAEPAVEEIVADDAADEAADEEEHDEL